MLTLYFIGTGLGQDELHPFVWIVPAVALLAAGLIACYSLRRTVCFLIAFVVALAAADAVLVGSMLFIHVGGIGSEEAGALFLLLGLGAAPFGFIAGLILSTLFLPKSLMESIDKPRRRLFIVPVLIAAGGLCLFLSETAWLLRKPRIDSADLFETLARDSPAELSNRRITGFHRNGAPLLMENQTLSGAQFVQVTLSGLILRNVHFDNCFFKQAHFEEITLENVRFVNCVFKGNTQRQVSRHGAFFEAESMRNVSIDGGTLDNFFARTRDGGAVVMRNAAAKSGKDHFSRMFSGAGLSLRVDACSFEGDINLHDGDGEGEAVLHITDSRFSGNIRCAPKNMKAIWIDGCHFEGGGIGIGRTLVIKNSHLGTRISQSAEQSARRDCQNIFVENCVFPLKRNAYDANIGTVFDTQSAATHVYIYGGNPRQKDINLLFTGGKASIFDAEVRGLRLQSVPNRPPLELNLHNVVIKPGPCRGEHPLGNWKSAEIVRGLWNDVAVYPQVDVGDVDIRNVTVHNLEFPRGAPWVNAAADTFADMIESAAPLSVPRPPVPTLEELGIDDPLKN